MPLEESLREYLLSSLFVGVKEEVTGALQKSTTWVVKISGIVIPYPMQTSYANFEISAQFFEFLTASLLTG